MNRYGSVNGPCLWHRDLLTEVAILVDGAKFGPFCLGIISLQANQSIFDALVEMWWDTSNSFYFPCTREMTMTPYDFSMITGLSVGGDPIPFDLDLS
ncbi:hypothetical protein ACSBR2_017623 [Camellia fascicularis]